MRSVRIGKIIWAIIAGSLIIHMFFLIAGSTFLKNWRWEHYPVHTSVEIGGAIIALLVATALIFLERRGKGTNYNIWIAGALIGMGTLDGLHSLVHVSQTFVWLHISATLSGGILFSLVWLPKSSANRRAMWWPLAVFTAVLIFGLGSLLYPELIPTMVHDNEFTSLARRINITGGLLLFIAAILLVRSYFQKKNVDDLLFCLHCFLFGAAAIMFEQSELWDATWWGWHLLRLMAYGVALSFIIITYQRTEDELEESEGRYRSIAENSSFGISTYDESGQCIVANQVLADMLGATVEGVLAQNIHNIPSWQKSGLLDAAKEAIASGKKKVKTVQIVTTFDKDVWLECTFVPYYEKEDKFLMFLAEEITKRKAMEAELLKSQKLESIGILAGGIAHDFNNLLTAIMNNLFLMKKHINPEDKAYERIIATERASVKAQSLTQQLLTFSKGGEPIKGIVDIRELVSESVSIAIRGSNVRCDNLIPNDLWHVDADAGQLNQAVTNILINADQSMPDGGTIYVNCENVVIGADHNLMLREGKYVKISIKDQGAGISDENRSKIFDPYFSTKEMGHGLGLSTAYSIIKKHAGHINIESELGAGTVFNIYLPASNEKVEIDNPVENEPLNGTGKILIMDDDKLVRDSLVEMLTAIGYVVEFAGDGREALDIYKIAMDSDNPFDAVIMDLTIPGGMGGAEAIKEFINIDPDVKAIVSSGYSYDPVMSSYKDYGFKSVLTKPYKNIGELNMILNNVVNGKV